jgi:hypothetical protein
MSRRAPTAPVDRAFRHPSTTTNASYWGNFPAKQLHPLCTQTPAHTLFAINHLHSLAHLLAHLPRPASACLSYALYPDPHRILTRLSLEHSIRQAA